MHCHWLLLHDCQETAASATPRRGGIGRQDGLCAGTKPQKGMSMASDQDENKKSEEDKKKALEQLAELNEISGIVKWKHVPFFGIPKGKWKVGAIWDIAYYDTAEFVIKEVVSGQLFPRVHGVVGVFLFRHFVELELKYILFYSRWLKDDQTNTKEEIEKIENIHYLDQLWADIKNEAPPKFGADTWKGYDIAFIDAVVKELNKVDPGSYGFRYSGKEFGKDDHSADPELYIDFDAILAQMKHVYYVLHAMKTFLIETHGMNADWEAEMNSF
jgi:hypothetical protein